MNEDAIAVENSIDAENTTTTEQHMTVEDGSPYECFPKESIMDRVGMFSMPCIFGGIYLAIVIFLIVLFYRLARATEKIADTTKQIADKIEYCIPPRQDN